MKTVKEISRVQAKNNCVRVGYYSNVYGHQFDIVRVDEVVDGLMVFTEYKCKNYDTGLPSNQGKNVMKYRDCKDMVMLVIKN